MKRPRVPMPSWIAAEFGILSTLTGAAAALFAFALVAGNVVEGDARAFDEWILLAFRRAGDMADPIGPAWLEIVVGDFTALGSTTVLAVITLLTAGFLLTDGKRAAALFVLAAIFSGGALSYLMKLGFDRPRPDLVGHLVNVHTLSFPSGHAMGAAVTYLTLGALIVRTQSRLRLKIYVLSVAIALTLLIGISRIYLGVHWPTDVLAGWAAGSAWALICWMLALWLQRRGKIEAGPETPRS